MTQTIEQLQAKVAELEEEENARLKAESRDASLGLNDYYGRKLAAEQLNNKRLRDALQAYIDEHEECEDADGWMAQLCSMEALHVADEALSTPFTPTALHELIEKVEKMTIERCAEKLLSIGALGDGDFLAAIRALPTGQIKLEELL